MIYKRCRSYSLYEINEKSMILTCMRMKFLHTYSVSSLLTSFCIEVSRLDKIESIISDKELKDIFALEIEGFRCAVIPTY